MVNNNGNLVSIDESEFEEYIRDNDNVVIDFWATWCSPCMAMNPILESMAEKFAGKVAIAKINVEENGSLASRYGVQAIPAFLFIQNGNVVRSEKGMLSKNKLEEIIADTFDI